MNVTDAEERAEMVEDFGKECRIMSMIRHPNIVQFFGSVQEAPNFCIISELCEGNVVDLLNLLSGRKINVTWRLLWGIANGAASALNYLHFENETQIIHRDVKAENLLLTEKVSEELERSEETRLTTQAYSARLLILTQRLRSSSSSSYVS